MTTFIAPPNADGLVKLTGIIKSLKVKRSNASFVLTAQDQSKLGILAVVDAFAGMDGQAAAASHYAGDMEEAADYLEFEIDGLQVKGWVWRNPFKDGDVVNAVVTKATNHWEAFGISRPTDRTVALYPHCSRGRFTHYKNAFKWWILGGGGSLAVFGVPVMYSIFKALLFIRPEPWVGLGGLMAAFGVMTFFLTRKWLPFVRVAERVFRALDLPNPSSIDLVKSSKAQRKPNDPGEYGTFYFRY